MFHLAKAECMKKKTGIPHQFMEKMINPMKFPLKLNPCINFDKIIATILR